MRKTPQPPMIVLRGFRHLGLALAVRAERERRLAQARKLRREAEAAAGGPEQGDEVALALRARP
jgi:hypothetical protein